MSAKMALERERLGTVTTSAGDIIKVHMPTLGDVVGINHKDPDFMYQVSAKAIGVPYNEFKRWSIPDAMKVVKLVGDAFSLFGDFGNAP